MKRFAAFVFLFLLTTGYIKGQHDLSFFCELPEREFAALFGDSSLINELASMKVSLRIGLHDFGNERTRVIKELNKAGIAVYAWLLLPEEDGYWFNLYNGNKAILRYEEFKKWTVSNQLEWMGVGLDIEPDMNDAKLATTHVWKFAWKAYKRLYDNSAVREGRETYQRLISEVKSDGYKVESYVIPFIFDERKAGTRSLQKLLGIADIETDTEIPMLYTSLLDNPGIIQVYGRKDMPLALGSTGGGVNIEGIELAAISWEKLERDLLIASGITDKIVIFCLETSVKRGFLEKIKKLDFNQPAPDITVEVRKQEKISKYVKVILVILDRPLILTIVLLTLISGIVLGLIRLITFLAGLL